MVNRLDLHIVGVDQADRLAQLCIETFSQAYQDVHEPEDIRAYCDANFSIESAMAELSDPQSVCCFGLRRNNARGYYVVRHRNCPIPLQSKSSELKQIYVLAAEYGTGLGQTLYEHAIASIRAAGSQWVWLCVSDINCRARAFYKKLDFKRRGPGPALVVGSERLASTIMARRL